MTVKERTLTDKQKRLAQRIANAGIAPFEDVEKAMLTFGNTQVKGWIDTLTEYDKKRLEEAKQNNPLDIAVEQHTGQQIIKHKIFAPWRDENTPSVHIYDDGKFKDFGEGYSGDIIDFLGLYYFGKGYDPSTQAYEVVDKISSLNIAPLPDRINRPAPKPVKQLTISLEDIIDWHDTMPEARRDYWRKRGLFDKTINEFFLGWDGRRYVIPHLYRLVPFGTKRRATNEDMLASRTRYKAEFDTIQANRPELTDKEIKKLITPPIEKYVSSPGSKPIVFNADCLWTTDKVVITEGEVDAMLLSQWGFPAVSSTAGAGTFEEKWAEMFLFVPKIWILYDNDEAGRKGEQLVHSILRRAKIVRYPQAFKDCGEMFEKDPHAVNWLYENLV